jgi:hypothetical protein
LAERGKLKKIVPEFSLNGWRQLRIPVLQKLMSKYYNRGTKFVIAVTLRFGVRT